MNGSPAPLAPLLPSATQRPRLTRDDVLDAHEVAGLLHLPLSTVFDYARRAVIPGHKVGRRWLFLRDEVEAAVRGAPSGGNANQRPEPPARHAPTRAQNRPKRYPRAVPSAKPASQPTLFG
jgi:excisionase family DNA binding protein